MEVIRELQKHYPIKRSPMKLRLTVPESNSSSLIEKLNLWNATIVSKDESPTQLSVVSPYFCSVYLSLVLQLTYCLFSIYILSCSNVHFVLE